MSTRKEDEDEEKKKNEFPWGWVILVVLVVLVIVGFFLVMSNTDAAPPPQKEPSPEWYIEEITRMNERSKMKMDKIHPRQIRKWNKQVKITDDLLKQRRDQLNALYD